MWERLAAWFRLLWDARQKTAEHSAAIDELDETDRRILQIVQSLAMQNELLRKGNENLRFELQREKEKRADELEKVELRLRLQIAQELRRLPPGENH